MYVLGSVVWVLKNILEAVVWVLRIVVGGAFLDPRSILVAVVWVFRNIVEAVNFLELCFISSSTCHTIW